MTLSKARRRAYELRQKDAGWGRAVAHLIPFYGLYYAISRRTITPFSTPSALASSSCYLWSQPLSG